MVGEQQFGGNWTEEKLIRVKKYLSAYATIMNKYPFKFAYIDAFAGTGYRELEKIDQMETCLYPDLVDEDIENYADGSARIALQVEPEFTKYIFIEKTKGRFEELKILKEEFPDKAHKIMLINEDANTYITNLCKNSNWKYHRAVMFLDPFGMQVIWDTIKAIAETKAIDLWYLFPLGVGVNRLLKRDIKEIPESWAKKLDDIFGTPDWRDVFYRIEKVKTLYGEEETVIKDADFKKISDFFVNRLETIFAGIAENPRLLRNSKNNPLYLLCFASGNPKGSKTAIKIAQDILRK
ncbi:MAG: three-Cys-motif partner protein TcmP [Candidatus Aminicenantes bacterium]|nr:three-Cys-motif partner protein TcmP [Candidatus Aminicenantes bacterium]NIM82551.1 three-Cys-motif partner protein TcmP [Candidatus Aminicenantes bacterium]NIN21911.1 three-Cys-motif partner protein TcmP [Candidatus Aminicenantes bacterium]NIN45689.1 three-Cys-motif partner protein TcmP [Candidatus Aminicenantes bacterium]NIN88524.1 three-Cys-motif partner protein TcmP [Candidatus Aminicenantes bacterium]